MERIYKAKFYDIKHFTMACELLSKTVENCTFKFNNSGVSITSLNEYKNILTKLTFDDIKVMCYKPEYGSIDIGINLKHLVKRLNKIVPSTPYIAMTVKKNSDKYILCIQDKPLQEATVTKLELPKIVFNCCVNIETTKLLDVINHTSSSKIVTIESYGNEIVFTGRENVASDENDTTTHKCWNYVQTPITNYLNEECDKNILFTKTSSTYYLAILNEILDATLSPKINLYLKNNFPLAIVSSTGCGKQHLYINPLEQV